MGRFPLPLSPTDVMLWNKNSQIDSVGSFVSSHAKLKSTSTELPPLASSAQSQDDMDALRIQRQALKDRNAQLSHQIDTLKLDLEEASLKSADNARKIDLLRSECDEWRRKYKEEVKKRQGSVVDSAVTEAGDKETIETLRQELEYLRSKNEQMMILVRKKEEKTGPAPVKSENNFLPPETIDMNSNDLLTKNVGEVKQIER